MKDPAAGRDRHEVNESYATVVVLRLRALRGKLLLVTRCAPSCFMSASAHLREKVCPLYL